MDAMDLALEEARAAADRGEVPVGAVLADAAGNIWAARGNEVELLENPAAHAELLVLQQAAAARGQKYLSDCTLTVTLEPCAMCAGAILHARIARLVYAAPDPKAGACGSVLSVMNHPALNHRVEVVPGVLANECSAMLTDFFRARRNATQTSS